MRNENACNFETKQDRAILMPLDPPLPNPVAFRVWNTLALQFVQISNYENPVLNYNSFKSHKEI